MHREREMAQEADGGHMPERNSPDAVERVAGSLPMAASAAVLSAFAGTPLAALLPVLTQTLAAGRQRARIGHTLQAITQDLDTLGTRLDELTDQQYQIVSSAVGAVFETVDPRKLDYLRRAARSAVDMEPAPHQEAVALGRLIRDISADEAEFLLANFGYGRVHLTAGESDHKDALVVRPGSPTGLIVRGLELLGVLETVDSMWDGTSLRAFSRLGGKLVTLLKA